MRINIKDILLKHKIVNPKLLEDLNALYTNCLQTGKRYGIKCSELKQMNDYDQEAAWHDIVTAIEDYVADKEDPFTHQNFRRVKSKYRIHNKNGGNLQST